MVFGVMLIRSVQTKESANENLSKVKEKYPDAYVKYSGDWLGK